MAALSGHGHYPAGHDWQGDAAPWAWDLLSRNAVVFTAMTFAAVYLFRKRTEVLSAESPSHSQAVRGTAEGRELCAEDCREFGAPDHPHIEAGFLPPTTLITNNAAQPFAFDNDNCKGYFLPLHRPTYDKALDSSGNYPYGDHFAGKKRVWEMRFQLQFKKRPGADLYFGVELETYVPLSAGARRAMDATVGVLRKGVGDALYHSTGDDPNQVRGELERPAFMMPLWAFDQFLETPEGEQAPSISDPHIASYGEHRVGRVREYKKAIELLDLRPGPTYTFCFWGVSRYFDVVEWQVQGIPLITPLDLNKYCGRPPIYLVFYTLKPAEMKADGSMERRHLQSRKDYFFRCGFWSSKKRPPREVVSRMVPRQGRAGDESKGRRPSTTGGGSNGVGSLLNCCVDRGVTSH